uniref:Putative lef-3 n=1 Tax=Kallithea virus TaxID=1654582 RepID=A0A0F7KLN8_9VIRU|nr:putative lef-3 [Kallithea virus]
MSHHNYRKLKTELTNQRNIRNINIAQTIIPLSKTDRVSVNAVMHKSLNGNILIGLNKSNMPTQAWRDIDGILPIRSKLIKSDKIRSVVASIRPRHLYLNDGELLRPISTLDIGQLHLYTDKTLMDVLHDIKMDALATLIPTTSPSPSPSSSYITKVLTPLSNFHLPSTSVEIVLNGDGYDNGSGGSSGDGDGGNNDTDVAKSLQKISPEESLPTLLTTSQLSLPVQSRASSSPSVDIISQNLTIPNVICHTKTVDDDGNGHCRCSSNGTTNNKIDEKRKSKVDLEHTEPSNDEKQQDRPPTYKDFCIMQPNLTKREYNAFCKQFHRQLAIREKQQQQKQQQQRRQSNNNTVGAKSNLRIKKNNL